MTLWKKHVKLQVLRHDVARLRAAYDAIRAGDPAPLALLMDENIRWIGDESRGDPPPECKSRDEALAVLKQMAGRIPSRDAEKIAISRDRILAVARWEEGQGPPGRDGVYNLLTMSDGQIVQMEDFFDRAAAEQAFNNPA
jgi:ketosteroid isomerase-like protein